MSTTRQQVIEKTSELLERQGYHATGLNQIVAESDTPRGSLYYYFPQGKEELATEAIQFKATQMSSYLRHHLAAYDDPIEAIYQTILGLAAHIEGAGCSSGAPIAAVALETASQSERLRQACQAAYSYLQAPLEEKLLVGNFPPDRAHALSLTINAAIEGAVILSRVEHSSQPLRVVAEEVRTMLLCASSAL
jgi:TetR/AcrR family transcriptional regulator, lmrAB and yxaGH operons repressor